MRKRNRFPALAVAVWIMAGSMVTEANAAAGNMERLLKGLDLTPEQKLRTEGIMEGRHGDLIAGKMAVLKARRKLLNVMNRNRLDEEVVRSAYKALTAAAEKLTVLRATILNEMLPFLTLEQRTAIKNKIAKLSVRAQRSMTKLQSKLNAPPAWKTLDRVRPGGGVFPLQGERDHSV